MGLGSNIAQRMEEGDSQWSILDNRGTIQLKRRIDLLESASQIDVFASSWAVTLGPPQSEPMVEVVVKGKPMTVLNQWIACFYPPFSIVEWRLKPGVHYFEGIFPAMPVPEDLPKEPVAFISKEKTLPTNPDRLVEFVRNAGFTFPIGKEDIISAPARRMKAALDANFLMERPLDELAREIGFNQATISRAFKKAYGLTPVAYRAKLRVYASVREIVCGRQISEVAKGSGFHDMSQYIRKFKSEMNQVPSSLR